MQKIYMIFFLGSSFHVLYLDNYLTAIAHSEDFKVSVDYLIIQKFRSIKQIVDFFNSSYSSTITFIIAAIINICFKILI